ncbi:MAG TPA: DUF2127 domain-containing protein [Polyangiaceae bacterium]|jgi:uncharacterized membrane protein (DUF2068 family)|nr:DUF2127 domain-containing protein [Polyangiaceae bacterium]
MAERTRRGIIAIGVMKLFKALALIVAGIGLLSLLHRDAAETVRHWIEYIRMDPHDRLIDHLLEKIAGVDHRTMRRLGIGTLFYAAVFCTEGMGLLLKQHWAEYLTTGVTASFLPLEIYELVRHPSVAKTFVVLLNIAVVIYLVREIRIERQHKRQSERDSKPATIEPAPRGGS